MNQIELIKVSDINAVNLVEALAAEIWTEYYTPIIGKAQVEYMLETLQSAKAINSQIENGFVYYLIKEEKDFRGYIAITLREKDLFLSKIYIKSSCRGLGYGRQVLEFVEKIAKENNLPKITLTVNKNNTESIKAYEKLGFVITESVVQEIGSGYFMDDYIMAKIL